jgi:CDP-diacylglycerol--glycerol-3-phosphate 3-phosphatidyltransferase
LQKPTLILRGGAGDSREREEGSRDEKEGTGSLTGGSAPGNPFSFDSTEGEASDQGEIQPKEQLQQKESETISRVPARVQNNPMGPNASPPGLLRKSFPFFPWHTLPNLLTYARCLAIPALIIQFNMSQHVHKNIHSALIFSIASITDYLDGYLARRWDICSPFGAFLDPVADKLMVSTALVLLSGKYGAVVSLPSTIILAREIAVSALREWMAARGQRDSVKVGFQGKCKTALTMMALTIVLAVPDGLLKNSISMTHLCRWTSNIGELAMKLGMIMLYLSALVTVTSGSVYFRAAAPVLMENRGVDK